MDQSYVIEDLTFTHYLIPSFGISSFTGYFTHPSEYFHEDQIRIHLSEVDEITQQHIDLIKMIRTNFPSILKLCIEKLLIFSGNSNNMESIKGKLTSPTILFAHDEGDLDRKSWVFEIAHDYSEIHMAFLELEFQQIGDFWDGIIASLHREMLESRTDSRAKKMS